jgi:general secretion pathway protein E
MSQMDIPLVLSKVTPLSAEVISRLLQGRARSQPVRLEDYLASKTFNQGEEVLIELCKEVGLSYLKDININDFDVNLIRDIPINFCKNHHILPIKKSEKGIEILTANPFQYQVFQDFAVKHEVPAFIWVTTAAKVLDAINRVYERNTAALDGIENIDVENYESNEEIIDLLEAGDDEAPIIKFVNSVLFRAVKEKASDIHFEPFERDMVIRFRVDGVLSTVFRPPKKLQNSIISRIKVMANLNIAEKRLPQDGRIPLKIGGKDIDIRVSTVPATFGERIVMRLQDRSNVILSLEQLGFSEENLQKIDDLIRRPYGIFLVTGPTGSGKSTTLYACLTRINTPDINILTIEDPVEQRIQGIGQVQVNPKIGLTFASGLRAFLRQDPEVIMVGEIRDQETAELAIQASLTGHLVFSTLHTNDSAGAFPRLLDVGAEPFLVATSVIGVAAQRLVRVLCPHCKERYTPSSIELESLGINFEQAANSHICRPVGCDKCNHKGYLGRTLIAELLVVDDEIRSLVLQRKDGGSIRKLAVQKGMKTFRDHGVQKVLQGVTTIEEVISNSQLDI